MNYSYQALKMTWSKTLEGVFHPNWSFQVSKKLNLIITLFFNFFLYKKFSNQIFSKLLSLWFFNRRVKTTALIALSFFFTLGSSKIFFREILRFSLGKSKFNEQVKKTLCFSTLVFTKVYIVNQVKRTLWSVGQRGKSNLDFFKENRRYKQKLNKFKGNLNSVNNKVRFHEPNYFFFFKEKKKNFLSGLNLSIKIFYALKFLRTFVGETNRYVSLLSNKVTAGLRSPVYNKKSVKEKFSLQKLNLLLKTLLAKIFLVFTICKNQKENPSLTFEGETSCLNYSKVFRASFTKSKTLFYTVPPLLGPRSHSETVFPKKKKVENLNIVQTKSLFFKRETWIFRKNLRKSLILNTTAHEDDILSTSQASRTIVITSGKGGVGKTTATANLGMSIARLGYRVALIDADIGLRNLDLLLGLENRILYTAMDILEGQCRLDQALIRDKRWKNLSLLSISKNRQRYNVTRKNMENLVKSISSLGYHFILIDCPAGIDVGFINAIAPAEEALIITTPEITAIRDADRVAGLLEANGIYNVKLLVNRVRPDMIQRNDMMSVRDVQEMLGIPLLGAIPEDNHVIISTNRGEPLVLKKKLTLSGIAFENAARRLIGKQDYFIDLAAPYKGVFQKVQELFFGLP